MAFISPYTTFFTACLRSSSGTSAYPASRERVGVVNRLFCLAWLGVIG